MVPVDVKQHFKKMSCCSEFRSCVKVIDVDILGSPSLILTVRTVSVDVKQQ